jgi:hypothetical protein
MDRGVELVERSLKAFGDLGIDALPFRDAREDQSRREDVIDNPILTLGVSVHGFEPPRQRELSNGSRSSGSGTPIRVVRGSLGLLSPGR